MKTRIVSFALFLSMNLFLEAAEVAESFQEVQDQNSLKILTPSLQTRKILKLRLDNGVQLYLVSDPNADESSAAVSVSVGSWNDPQTYPGMAHFCEHMLFLGTKTYPDEGAFQQFITDHGGFTNAYTAPDRTVYMFSINNDSFREGFERFSRFFVDPLFNVSGVARELHAVDEEHAKNIESDSLRQWMIFKEKGNPAHPNHQFATGNAETLGHIPQKALVDWYQENYIPSHLHVVAYSNADMDTLKKESISFFSQIPKQSHKDILTDFIPLTTAGQKGRITYIKPIKDLKILTLEWELPQDIALDIDTKSADLIAYVLRHSLDNGLSETLKKEEWIESLQAGVGQIGTAHHIFHLQLILTKQGIEKLPAVITTCFEAINNLKASRIPPYLFEEMNQMSEVNYEYQSKTDALNFTSTIADELIDEPLETYPQKTLVASRYSQDTIEKVLHYLTPQNCLFYVMASPELTKIQPKNKEKWLGGEYSVRKISPHYMTLWTNQAGTTPIGLPTANPYIPKHLTLVNNKGTMLYPTLLSSTFFGESYYISDDLYKVPEVSFIIGYKSPFLNGTIQSIVLGDLYTKTFHQTFSQTLQLARAAGLHPSLNIKDFKMTFSLQGFSENATDLLNQMLFHMKDFSLSDSQFSTYKDSLLTYYENQKKSPPYAQAQELTSHLLIKDHPTIDEKIIALQTLSKQDLLQFQSDLFSKGYFESLYGGNLTKETAVDIDIAIQKILGFDTFPSDDRLQPQILMLSPNQGPFMVTEDFDILGQAALLTIEEGTFSFEKKASQIILKNVLSNDFYNALRTKQQTGYIVQSWARDYQLQLLQYFLIQSNTHQGEDLITRTEAFLEDFLKDFQTVLSENRFQEIKDSTIKSLKEPATNLSDYLAQLYTFAFEYKGNFQFKEDLINALHALSYQQLSSDAQTFLNKKNPRRLAVIIEGRFSKDTQFKYEKITSEALKGFGTYILSQQASSPQ